MYNSVLHFTVLTLGTFLKHKVDIKRSRPTYDGEL